MTHKLTTCVDNLITIFFAIDTFILQVYNECIGYCYYGFNIKIYGTKQNMGVYISKCCTCLLIFNI